MQYILVTLGGNRSVAALVLEEPQTAWSSADTLNRSGIMLSGYTTWQKGGSKLNRKGFIGGTGDSELPIKIRST